MVREALVASMARRDPGGLGRLARAMESAVARPARAGLGPPAQVTFVSERTPGPWLGYLFQPEGPGCWLALGWQPAAEAAAMRDSVRQDLGSELGAGRIGAVPGTWEPFEATVLSVEYRPGSLPSDHNLVNDLHAMVMLHDLLLG